MNELIRSVETNSEPIKVTILTKDYHLRGTLHLSKVGKDDRRLTNLLNGDRKFIALTDVQVAHRQSGGKDANSLPFIQVNISCIEMVIPHL